MFSHNLLRHTCLLALMGCPLAVTAAPSTEPLFTVGILGAYDEFKFEGGRETQTEHVDEGGIFANFGNKMTAESGFIYQVGAEGKYAERHDNKLKEGQAGLDLGWRAAVDARNFVDVIVGSGYMWSRLETEHRRIETELTYKAPFAKAALGYNHQFDSATLRMEAGVRRTLNGEVDLDVRHYGSDDADMQDRTNPYAEFTLLMNQQGNLPIQASVYYTRTKYQLDDQTLLADNTELKREEYGFKLGLAF